VPLSEHEQRLLDQIERALYADDPKFASTVRATDLHTHYRKRIIKAAAGFIVGVALLPVGLALHLYPLSILGFLIMLGCVLYAGASWKRMSGHQEGAAHPLHGGPARFGHKRGRKAGQRATFMQWLEMRWDRRWDERGR
jgi:hypothetical protein